MRVQSFFVPAAAAAMLLAIAGCDTNTSQPYAGAGAAAPITFPAETSVGRTLGMSEAMQERRENE